MQKIMIIEDDPKIAEHLESYITMPTVRGNHTLFSF